MYLKKLDMLGFKSFANKTTLKFSDGLTAIVGPNGCGKTNILDALRWVLGEQKPTLLRGGKMEEVIFNGTSSTKPLGMAEVTLTVVNDRGILATEYNEVQITRRLFRSGESEYLLNKVPCRLKDITDLFVDTGMGAHSYSVIQPEMIDAVISDKAEERRFLFEEAAGVTKYKQRRKAALRKLEATENDFLRLRDIYAEVKTRVNSLHRQHKKAERYQMVVKEIETWELYLNSLRMNVLDNEKRTLAGTIDALSNQKLDRETSLGKHSAQLESERKNQIDIERQLSEIGGEIYSVTESAHGYEREISVLGEKKTNAEQLVERNNTDVEALQRRLDTLVKETASLEQRASEQSRELEKKSTELSAAQGAQADVDRRLLAARSDREKENRRLVELEGQLSSGRTEEQNLQQRQTELNDQIADIEKRTESNLPRQKELLSRLTSGQEALDSLTAGKQEADRRKTELTEQMEQLAESGDELALEISDLKASIEACEARRKLLGEMILHYEGYQSGVVAAMEEKDRWSGIMGTVAEKFVPVEGMEIALEAALGDMAGFLICRDRDTAIGIIDYLKSEKKGKIGIMVPDTGAISPAVKRPQLDQPGIVGWLDSLVSADSDLQPLKDAVLSRTIIFDSNADPVPILEHLPYGFGAVSTEGVVFRTNVISGGSDDSFPLFRRQEKIQEQDEKITQLTERLQSLTDQQNRTVAQMAAARAEFNDISGTLDELAEEIKTAQVKIGEVDFEHRTLSAEFERLDREKQALTGKLESMRSHQCSLELDSSQLASLKENLVNDMSRADSLLVDLESQAAEAIDRLSKLQVAAIEARGAVEQTESQIKHFAALRAELSENLKLKTEEIDSARQEIEHAGHRIATLEQELKTAFLLRDEKTARQEKIRESQAELLDKVSTREKDLKQVRDERDRLSEALHELEMKLNTLESDRRSIKNRIQEEYEVDINSVEATHPDERVTTEQAPEHLAELKERLKKFGAVNLLALEEYSEASSREEFLREQLADLETAKNDLKSTISRINQTACSLFTETLNKVQANFQRLFVDLFTGGEANIRLIDPSDPLESDIEIIARPRGKKLLSITMMSGGERALTAIALLFSLYLVKPSPFCILDEIDAPLDDANCHRFLSIIRTFSEQTQFISITHNKITMEASDNLYGITMELPGISKLVAVRFGVDGGDAGGPSEEAESGTEAPSEESLGNLPETIRERINPEMSFSRKNDT